MDSDLQPTLHQRCEWIHTFPFRVFLFNKYKIKPAPRWLGLEPHESDRKNICVSLCVHSFMHLASADLWPRASFIHIYHRGMQLILCVTAPSISQTNREHLPRIFSSSCRLDSRIWSMSEWIRTSCCRTDIRQSSFSAESPSSRCSWTRM